MKPLELGAALSDRLRQFEQDIIESECLDDAFDQLSIGMEYLVDTSSEWNWHENANEQEMLQIAHQWDCLGWWNYYDHDTEALYYEFCKESPQRKISRENWFVMAYLDAYGRADKNAATRISDHLYYVEDVNIEDNYWRLVFQLMSSLYYCDTDFAEETLKKMAAVLFQLGWEWTGATNFNWHPHKEAA